MSKQVGRTYHRIVDSVREAIEGKSVLVVSVTEESKTSAMNIAIVILDRHKIVFSRTDDTLHLRTGGSLSFSKVSNLASGASIYYA